MQGRDIEIPENLFKALDRIHAKASSMFNSIPQEGKELISPSRVVTNNKNQTSGIKPKF